MPGNLPSYDKIDLIRCFLLLEENASRRYLSLNLGVGEGSIRSILDDMKEKGLIESSRKGHMLSSKGKTIRSSIMQNISCFYGLKSKKFLEKYFPIYPKDSVAYVYYHKNSSIRHLYIYRDFAIKAGADGALILRCKDNKFFIPDYNFDISDINKMIRPKKGYVIMVIAKNKKYCHRGIINILLHMTDIFKALR